MSTALYRRYRPDTFADVIGQEHVTAPLMTALDKDAVSHAYLFSGPRGCGKTTSARILARCLNCAEGPTPTPCGTCDSCTDLATGGPGSLDVIEIDAASHGGVDDARDLRERATFAPVRDRYKIFIIDEAHMVTAAGFNALLKIVEEPPEHIKFIFATTEPDKVIGTIRSRTHHYPFRLVPPEPLLDYLDRLSGEEGVSVAPGVLPLVLRAGGGSVRDTLSVLDQLIAGSSAEGIAYDRAVALLGFTHSALLDDVVDSLASRDGAQAFDVVDRVVQSGQDPRRFVEDLLERMRDLIIVKSVPENPEAILRGVAADQIAKMQEQAGTVGSGELSRSADVTAQALTDMVGATSPRLHLELLMARLLLPHADEGTSSLAARLDQMERRLEFLSGGGAPQPAPSPEPVPAPATTTTQAREAASESEAEAERPEPPQPERPEAEHPEHPESSQPAAPSGESSRAEMMQRAWPDVVHALASQSRLVWMLVKDNTSVAGFDGRTLTLSFANDGARGTFANRNGERALGAAIHQVLGMEVGFDLITGGAPPAADQDPKGPSRSTPVEDDAAPAWVREESPEEQPPPDDEPPPEDPHDLPPSPHPAQAEGPWTDPADEPEEPGESEEPGWPDHPDGPADAYRRTSAPQVPAFARPSQSAPTPTQDSPRAPGPADPADQKGTPAPSSSSPDSSPASSKIAAIRDRMARRQEPEAPSEPPPPPPDPAEPPPPEDEVPSDDDIAVEDSAVFGRRAVERLLGGTLVEERSLTGEPL
ncbi:MAG: DNA polymerase III subunit gamma and tau [Nesterenkonia sp.]|nr:DNA polymerase III subunit gamma and tau [Nesterenkonia sp.]